MLVFSDHALANHKMKLKVVINDKIIISEQPWARTWERELKLNWTVENAFFKICYPKHNVWYIYLYTWFLETGIGRKQK